MSSYGDFARFYDGLTEQVDYGKRAAYFHRLAMRYGMAGEALRLLDLGCGTGSLSYAMQRLGYQVTGVDGSENMLAVAYGKGEGIPFICQDFAALDLGSLQVDVAVSALDCLNHVLRKESLSRLFRRLHRHIRPGGLFLFDVNTPYKHREVLADNVFVYDTPEVYCVWQNETNKKTLRTNIWLDFFVPQPDGSYHRYQEQFQERVWHREELEEVVASAGFRVLAVLGEDCMRGLREKDQRAVYAVRRESP